MLVRALALAAVAAFALAGCGAPKTPGIPAEPHITLDVVVRDAADSQPVPQADVQVTPQGKVAIAGRTDDQGRVRMQVPAATSCAIVVAHPRYVTSGLGFPCSADAAQEVRLVRGTGLATPTPAQSGASVPAAVRVDGTLQAAQDGAPIEAALVVLDGTATTRTDGQGRFTFQVAPGAHVIEVGAGCWTEASFPLAVEGPTSVVLELERDTNPPAVPAVDAVAGPGPGQLTLVWDDVAGAVGYWLHLDGEPRLRLGRSTAYAVPAASSTDRFTVAAFDDCGQQSAPSEAVSGAPLVAAFDAAATVPAIVEGDVIVQETTYPAYGADGAPLPARGWRVVDGTGNCCENYLAVTQAGLILDQGSSPVFASDDEGQTWRSHLHPAVQFYGEGSVAAAPDGDVVAFDWSTYNADTAFAYRYSAFTGTWQTTAVPKPPFFDRPWIGVLKGPFVRGDLVAPYVVVVQGLTGLLLSLDGLHYEPVTLRQTQGQVDLRGRLPGMDPDRDWISGAGRLTLLPWDLGLGYLDPIDNGVGAFEGTAGLSGTTSWTGMLAPGFPGNVRRVDGGGGLHALAFDRAPTFTYSWSHDGGLTWGEHEVAVPGDVWQAELRVNRALDQAIVAVHLAKDDGNDLYRAYRFTGLDAAPRLVEWLDVGLGDAPQRGNLAGGGQRFDLMTVGLLPTGRIVMSFSDSQHPDPAIAIEL